MEVIVVPFMIVAIVAIMMGAKVIEAGIRSKNAINMQTFEDLVYQLREENAALHQELVEINAKVSSMEKMMKDI